MENLDVVNVGKRIREKRPEYNLTQDKLAQMIGITGRHLYDLEKGRRAMSVDILYKIKEILGVSADWLLSGDDS